MRADRLISLLLLLQRQGRITAAEAAQELEVSVKTARRDLEALAMSGVPIYPQPGRGGGWQLIGGATTDLTGLTEAETRSLFLAIGPQQAALPELQSALQKLSIAVPETFRQQASAASGAIKVDTEGWGTQGVESPPLLSALSEAIVRRLQVELGYNSPRSGPSVRTASPLGLINKGRVWYLVANTDQGLRTFRVDRVSELHLLSAHVDIPDDFDLDSYWDTTTVTIDEMRLQVSVIAAVRPETWRGVQWIFGTSQCQLLDGPIPAGSKVPHDWLPVRLRAQNARVLAAQMAGFGADIIITEPNEEVTTHLRSIGSELTARYGTDGTSEC